MRNTGIVRRIDYLGRIVIPREIRKQIGIKDDDSFEILTDINEGMVTFKHIKKDVTSVKAYAQPEEQVLESPAMPVVRAVTTLSNYPKNLEDAHYYYKVELKLLNGELLNLYIGSVMQLYDSKSSIQELVHAYVSVHNDVLCDTWFKDMTVLNFSEISKFYMAEVNGGSTTDIRTNFVVELTGEKAQPYTVFLPLKSQNQMYLMFHSDKHLKCLDAVKDALLILVRETYGLLYLTADDYDEITRCVYYGSKGFRTYEK